MEGGKKRQQERGRLKKIELYVTVITFCTKESMKSGRNWPCQQTPVSPSLVTV